MLHLRKVRRSNFFIFSMFFFIFNLYLIKSFSHFELLISPLNKSNFQQIKKIEIH